MNISPAAKKLLLELLQRYLPNTEVWAYGSRVQGTSTAKSDLDLVAFVWPAQKAAVADLKEALDESNLPFRVDFFVWMDIPQTFQKRILAEHVVVQAPADDQSFHDAGRADAAPNREHG